MAAKKFSHHFVPHHHIVPEEEERVVHHRAHALNPGALFGYLIIFVFTIAGFYFVRINAPQILGTATYTAQQIVELTNIKRAEHGLSPLVLNLLLSNAAAAKAGDMFAEGYWAHYSPSGKTPWKFISDAGYKYIYAGENLARDFYDPQSVVEAWMASPTHRENILDKNFKEIGVAVESGDLTGREGVLVVQMFGSGVSQVPSPQQLAQIPSAEEQTQQESITQSPGLSVDSAQNESFQSTVNREQLTVNQNKPVSVLASRQYSISKLVSLLFVGFVFGLFLLEVAIVSKKRNVSLKSSTLAHLGLLGLVLFTVWWATAGSVI